MAAPKLAIVDAPKVPPHSLESEQSVLGGLMLSATAWDQVADKITEADFYREDHRLIFQAINDLHEASRPCDAVTVSEWFESHGKADHVDGAAVHRWDRCRQRFVEPAQTLEGGTCVLRRSAR